MNILLILSPPIMANKKFYAFFLILIYVGLVVISWDTDKFVLIIEAMHSLTYFSSECLFISYQDLISQHRIVNI